ncbi:MAG: EcsC family protein [Pseudomonadota bacterium]
MEHRPRGPAAALSPAHRAELEQAKRLLEHPGYVAKVSNMIGMPLDRAVRALPPAWSGRIARATTASLSKCLRVANATLRGGAGSPSPKMHSMAVAVTGAAGGAFGIAGLALELPVSTVVMLRSIAEIGRAQGEDLATSEAQLACLMVFSLGGKAAEDDAAESGYFAARMALAKAMSEAAVHLSQQGAMREGAPALVRLIAQIATKFNVQVSQKAAAMMVPVIGAAGGALLNTLFMHHFQDMARGHFTVRRLERVYGAAAVNAAYHAS